MKILKRENKTPERKRIDERQLKSNTLIQCLLASMKDGLSILDNHGVHIEVNNALCQMTGFTMEELLGTGPPHPYWPEEEYEKIQAAFQKTLKGEFGDFELVFKRKNGERFPVIVSPSWLKDDDGNVISYFATIKNITERKIADERYKAVIQSAVEGFCLLDMDGNILDVNDSFCSMHGYSHEELLTVKIQDIDVRYIKEPAQFEKDTPKPIGNSSAFQEVKHRRKDGQIIDVAVSCKYLNIIPGLIFCFHRDITEQKKLFQQLEESEERYRALIELGDRVGEAVVMLQDTDKGKGMQTFVSDKWLYITGYSREELLGMSFFDILHPKYHRDSIRRHKRKINGNKIPEHFEMSIIRKDSTEVPIEVTSAYSTYQGKKVNVAYIRDISELKRIEKNLKQYHSNLVRLVEERTAELERANNNLVNMSQSKTEFIQAIIHELKTPITPIQAASEVLIAELPEGPLQDLAKQIHRGAQNLNLRVDELRDVARSERGFLKINRQPLDIEQLIKDTVAYITPEAKAKNLSIYLNIINNLPVITGDRERICQVLLNLINNAIKFTQAGGSITIQALRERDEIIVEVQDTGRGMSKTELQHLFKPYYKPNIKKQSDGLGLGLVLSKKFIELHGGRIYAESRKHKGSIFKFTLPIAPVS